MSAPTLTRDPRRAPVGPAIDAAPLGSSRQLLWGALRTRRRDLLAASVLYSTHQLGESMVPVVIGLTISRAVDHGSWASIGLWIAVLAADFVFLSMSYRFGARASMRAKQHTGHQVRMWLTDRVVGPAGGVDHPPGDLLSRASSDASRVGAYAGMFAVAVAAAVVLIVSTVVLLWFSLLLGAVIVAGTVLLLVVQNAASRLLRRRSSVEQYRRARATALAEDLVRGLRVLKGIGAQRNAVAEYRRASGTAVSASLHATSSQAALASVGSLLTGVYLVSIAGLGGWLALNGHLDLGRLVAALGLAQFVIGPMRTVSGASAAYARALASAERVREVLVSEPAVEDAGYTEGTVDVEGTGDAGERAASNTGAGELEFADVALDGAGTAGSDRAGFTLTATIPPGTMTGIVCGDPVVAGRIPQLLAREHDPSSGTVLLDHVPIAELPLDRLRTRVLVSHHDTVLLPGTIADNLAALCAEPTAVLRAAEAAFADQVVRTVPGGERTPVGDRGETLSGGQRQRVALARVLAADPPVLVLHDPTTAVDAATEAGMAERVRQLRAGRTTLVITTSPAWLSHCDRIAFLAPGECRVGSHAALLHEDAYRVAVAR